MKQGDEIEFHRAGEEWTAVYLNGELQRVGDHYLADEWLQQYAGVKEVHNSVCMIDNYRAYPTLDEVRAATDERAVKLLEAADLERQAAELQERAKGLRA